MGEPEHDAALDLEDGEIESDGDEPAPTTAKPAEEVKKEEEVPQKKEKKKKSKNHKKEEKIAVDKPKRKHPSPVEDDFAGKVEKAIRKQMKHDEGVVEDAIAHDFEDDVEIETGDPDERRKSKKRKKHDSSGSKKKRKRKHDSEELNDEEFMFTRGASPPPRHSPSLFEYRSDNSYDSGGSYDEHRPHGRPPMQRNRPPQHARERKNAKNQRRRENVHPIQDASGVCLYFMQGKCHKGDDCSFSHDAQPPRKMELCKFYLMDCCAKRDKCLYLHSDFPCKYYHTGLQCKSDCKFSHGGPLSDSLRTILLKHIESAPKEILGDFPRLSRDNAIMMIDATQVKLSHQYGAPDGMDSAPSFYDANPNQHDDGQHYNQYNDKHANRNAHKNRHSRWQTSTVDIPNNYNSLPSNMNNGPNNYNSMSNVLGNPINNQDVLSIRNLTGVLTPQQISDLTKLGIENLNQLTQLTVIQLNRLGLNLKQINEIQLNTMSIQKLGLIDGGETSTPVAAPKDLDMRVAPRIPEVVEDCAPRDSLGQDVDMRFQSSSPAISNVASAHINTITETKPSDPRVNDPRVNDPRKNKQQVNKDTIDIDQYTKDALKFASKDRVNDESDDFHDHGELSIDEQLAIDTDHRTLRNEKERTVDRSNNDTGSRFLHPDNFTKKPEKRHRRSTTDDEDNLLIDEKWYSSDEEKSSRTKSPRYSPRGPTTPPKYSPQRSPRRPSTPPEPASIFDRLGDLSKIQVSDEVTKLLATMKNNLKGNQSPKPEAAISRDPRSQPKKSPEHKPTNPTDLIKTIEQKKPRVSIYEYVEGATSDRRRRSDVDLRQLDPDFRLPPLGDTDLRADVDFRLGMPFKPLPNHTPATEIDGSINSHPPIAYKLRTVEVPRPDYSDIKNGTAESQAVADPRLRKLFRLSVDEPNGDGERPSKPVAPRADPRKKPSPAEPDLKPASVDIQNVTNNSSWYKELSTNQKIFVNQQLATVNGTLKKYQQLEKPLGRRFDVSQLRGNPIVCSIFNNLGVSVDEAGEISYAKSPEGLIESPLYMGPEYGQMMDGASMMGGPPPMPMPIGPMNPMGGFGAPFPNPANMPAPGLLGYAPNMPAPPGFGLSTYGGQGPDGYRGNGGVDYGNDDDCYNGNQGRGNYRGRGGDRWSRGGPQHRRHYDKGGGGWKGDRH